MDKKVQLERKKSFLHQRHSSIHGDTHSGAKDPRLDSRVAKEMNAANSKGIPYRVVKIDDKNLGDTVRTRITIVTTNDGKFVRKYYG